VSRFPDALTDSIAEFLVGIGIGVSPAELPGGTFLPGVRIHEGALLVDSGTLLYPGDLLHEAGHLAPLPAASRRAFGGPQGPAGVDMRQLEIQAWAWSYAAALHIPIDPAIVFHAGGYKGRSAGLLQNFQWGAFVGVSDLAAAGMTVTPAEAERLGVRPYPHMLKWLHD
jgi:hypothetical protein